MKAIFPGLLLLALTLSACVADSPPGWGAYGGSGWGSNGGYGGEREARYACVDRAEQTGNQVRGVRSVDRENWVIYRVSLDIRGVREPLICYYEARSGNTELHWRNARR